jgi:hypothetical protein
VREGKIMIYNLSGGLLAGLVSGGYAGRGRGGLKVPRAVADALQRKTNERVVPLTSGGRKALVLWRAPEGREPQDELVKFREKTSRIVFPWVMEWVPGTGAARIREEGLFPEVGDRDVARWFLSRTHGADTRDLVDRGVTHIGTMAPGAYDSFSYAPLSGDLGSTRDTPDRNWSGNSYYWTDTSATPVGGAVFKVTAALSVWFFHKLESDRWSVYCLPAQGEWPSSKIWEACLSRIPR